MSGKGRGGIEPMKIKPTMCNGKITGYCVDLPNSDACAEFHGGTQAENLAMAELFLRGLGALDVLLTAIVETEKLAEEV